MYSALNFKLVSWSLTSLFSTNMAISEERSGVDSYPYPITEGQRYINLNPGRLSVQQPPKKGKGSKSSLSQLFVDDVSIKGVSKKKRKQCMQQNWKTVVRTILVWVNMSIHSQCGVCDVSIHSQCGVCAVQTWFWAGCRCCCCISCVTVLSRLLWRSPAVSCTSTSGLVATATTSGTLVSTGVHDVTGVDGVVRSAHDDSESLALTTGKHDITDTPLEFTTSVDYSTTDCTETKHCSTELEEASTHKSATTHTGWMHGKTGGRQQHRPQEVMQGKPSVRYFLFKAIDRLLKPIDRQRQTITLGGPARSIYHSPSCWRCINLFTLPIKAAAKWPPYNISRCLSRPIITTGLTKLQKLLTLCMWRLQTQ